MGVAIGYCLIRYAYPIVENTSPIGWVENFVGVGRTADFYRILGVLVVIASLLLSVGQLGSTLRGILGFFAKLLHIG